MNKLTIIVAGTAGTGKSTMTLLLEQFLLENGFNAKIQVDSEIFDYGSEENFRKEFQKNFNVRKTRVKENTEISLKQMQLVRGELCE